VLPRSCKLRIVCENDQTICFLYLSRYGFLCGIRTDGESQTILRGRGQAVKLYENTIVRLSSGQRSQNQLATMPKKLAQNVAAAWIEPDRARGEMGNLVLVTRGQFETYRSLGNLLGKGTGLLMHAGALPSDKLLPALGIRTQASPVPGITSLCGLRCVDGVPQTECPLF
jgi:hypothetical protein